MKKILKSLPFLFIFGLIIWTVNSIVASMFVPGRLVLDSSLFSISINNIYFRIIIMFSSVLLYMLLFRIFLYERDEKLLRKAFNHSFPMCITEFNGTIIEANDSYREVFNISSLKGSKVRCSENRPSSSCHTENCPLVQIKNGKQEITCEHTIEVDGELRYYDIKAKPIKNSFDEVVGIIETFNDITERQLLVRYNQKLIKELKGSLEQVKLLSGMLPVCTSCKQVRSDNGYWEQIESYLGDKSEVEIISSLCPDCKVACDTVIEDLFDDERDRKVVRMNDMKWLKVAS